MKKIPLLFLLITAKFGFAQKINLINSNEVERIEKVLSADDMQGRRTGTPGIEKAAAFISSEFKAAGLKRLPDADTYLQKFTMVRPRLISASATLDAKTLNADNLIVITSLPELSINEKSGYEKAYIKAGSVLSSEAQN